MSLAEWALTVFTVANGVALALSTWLYYQADKTMEQTAELQTEVADQQARVEAMIEDRPWLGP